MSAFFHSGRVIDFILMVFAVEIAILIFWRRLHVADIALAALPGLFLLFAVRAALTGEAWIWIAVWLAASFPAHLADLWRRQL